MRNPIKITMIKTTVHVQLSVPVIYTYLKYSIIYTADPIRLRSMKNATVLMYLTNKWNFKTNTFVFKTSIR